MRRHLIILFLVIMMPMNAHAQNIVIDRASTIESNMEVGTAGVFMIIENKGSEADALISATSEIAGTTELHTMNVDNEGVMRMRPAQLFPLAAGGSIVFAPANDHIMLLDMKRAIAEGDEVPMVLKFEKAGDISVNIKVMALDDLMKNFPPELSLKNLEQMKAARERIDGKATDKSWLTRLRERFQNLKGGDKEETKKMMDPETLPTAEEVEAMERMKQMGDENTMMSAPSELDDTPSETQFDVPSDADPVGQ